MTPKTSDKARAGEEAGGVLIVAAGGIGDAVLFSVVFPLFQRVAEPQEKITLLLRHDAAKMAFLFPPEVRVVPVNFTRFRDSWFYRHDVISGLRVNRFRLAISADYLRHPKLDEKLIAGAKAKTNLAMEAKPWAKYDRRLKKNRRLFARLFDSGPAHTDKVLRWTRFANWFCGEEAPPPLVRLPEGRLLAPPHMEHPVVVLVPFSAVLEKQPSPALFAKILDSLPKDHDVIVAGAPNDLTRNPDYAGLLDRPNVKFDTSRFDALVPSLRAARLVISADTAAMHLSVAVGAPTLCLASAAYVGEIVPYAPEITPDNAHFIYTPMDCAGCLGACIHPTEGDRYPCVARLNQGAVLEKVRSLLNA